MTLKLAATVAVLASLALPSIALADVDVTNTPLGQQLLGEAQSYWNRTPDCQTYTILEGPILDQGIDERVAGEAAMPGCWMRIAEVEWLHASAAVLCVIATHEYGHSLGEPHDTNPYSVMDPEADFSTGKPTDCTELETVEVREHAEAFEAEGHAIDARQIQALREGEEEEAAIKRGAKQWAKRHHWHKRSKHFPRRRARARSRIFA